MGMWSRILAGSVAGLSILALDDSNRRRTFALYLLARLAQVIECTSFFDSYKPSEIYLRFFLLIFPVSVL